MTYKWNLEAVQRYSAQVAQQLTNRFYAEKKHITGLEISQFTELKSLNWLILKQLFQRWEEEIARWKSPYFDYSVAEVQEAQQLFFNRASQHILVQRPDFQPLVQQAITDLIALILSPTDFFSWQGGATALSAAWWEKNRRYLLVQPELCQQLQQQSDDLSESQLNACIIQHALSPMAEVFDPIWAQFNQWQPLPTELTQSTPNSPKPEVSASSSSFFDQLEPQIHIPTVPSKPLEYIEKVLIQEKPAAFPTGTRNFNDVQTNSPSVGDIHQKSKITSIMGSLSINQKFTYINQLFQGDAQLFRDTVEDLESSVDFLSARDKLVKKYVPRFIWDVTAPEVEEFFDMVERRFK